jgi:hypothetical protein
VNEEKVHYGKLYSGFPKHYVEEIVEKTGWIFSYVTFAEGRFDKGTPMLRLGVIHPSMEIIGRQHLADDFPVTISPIEATQEEASDIDVFLNNVVKPIEQFKTIKDSIQYHGLQVAELMQKISPDFPSVSPYCQVGVHTLDGRTGISKFVKPGDTKVSIRLTYPRT